MLSLLLCTLNELALPTLILVCVCFIYVKFASVNRLIRSGPKQNILFVTAHPDDECMFFAPTILSTLKEGHSVYLVCLSKGDYDNQGDVRKKELIASCSRLGVMPNHVTIVDDERFKDGPENEWDIDGLVDRIVSVIKRINADSVITFDSSGVSGHANHIALSKAVVKIHMSKELNTVSFFMLHSSNIVRKYMSFLDIPVSSIFNLTTFVSLPSEIVKSWRAMSAHQSQMVWFRKLYIVFSRYMYVNTLTELT
ncbi:N-acetylglucosaminyl-phosphatidylinositol de-N-acetylase-like [Ruditapes philippinarum]|uniref:N-acetylglucosaminyl-phosphatidylinositol de-N-acetylase-like n=1 Tax=Ruditapes philippinarum TaxID=129788 RepID=UPI00295BB33A|nr:N-acetylglucosaminyl-phosphatidylinositol de-N-acetylase-like [Ruditapes philippinarum]